jgi:hypothetical protein
MTKKLKSKTAAVMPEPRCVRWDIPADLEVPKAPPRSARFVAEIDLFSQTPMNARSDRYVLSTNRSRSHWLLWKGFYDDNRWVPDWDYSLYAYMPRAGVPPRAAARALLACGWRAEHQTAALQDPPEAIVSTGLLSLLDLADIACEVWPETADPFDGEALFESTCEVIHHLPRRNKFKLQAVRPAQVGSARELPPYLLWGRRDDASFRLDRDGWSIRFQGVQRDTWLQWEYRRDAHENVFTHRWLGQDGTAVRASADEAPANALAALVLDGTIQRWEWTAAAQRYAVDYIPSDADARQTVFLPDGPLRLLVLPLALSNAKAFALRWADAVDHARLPFPLQTQLEWVDCELAYLDRYHDFGADAAAALAARCERQTGQAPQAVRRVDLKWGKDGEGATQPDATAWEVRCRVPCAVTAVPLVGVEATLALLHDIGAVQRAGAPLPLDRASLDGAQPLVVGWDAGRGGRLTLRPPGAGLQLTWDLWLHKHPLGDQLPVQPSPGLPPPGGNTAAAVQRWKLTS